MKKLLIAATMGLCLGGCMVSIPNPFGGPPLMLTGSLANDMPGILAYEQAVKAGIKSDVASAQAFLIGVCPSVSDVASAVSTADANAIAGNTGITVTAAQKQISNATQGVQVAQAVCAGGTATDIKTAALNFVNAAKIVYSWFAKTS